MFLFPNKKLGSIFQCRGLIKKNRPQKTLERFLKNYLKTNTLLVFPRILHEQKKYFVLFFGSKICSAFQNDDKILFWSLLEWKLYDKQKFDFLNIFSINPSF